MRTPCGCFSASVSRLFCFSWASPPFSQGGYFSSSATAWSCSERRFTSPASASAQLARPPNLAGLRAPGRHRARRNRDGDSDRRSPRPRARQPGGDRSAGRRRLPLRGPLAAHPQDLPAHPAFRRPRRRDKDESTEEHTRRVALRAVQVGEELGLPPGRLRSLAIGGLLHDIGKLSVPERILKKPAALDDDEFAAIKRHPERGVRLLRELGGFAETVHDIVRNHHERLDGRGYPRGLVECDLTLDTRILTVCDVYDALVSPRVYRSAWSQDAALGLLRAETS